MKSLRRVYIIYETPNSFPRLRVLCPDGGIWTRPCYNLATVSYWLTLLVEAGGGFEPLVEHLRSVYVNGDLVLILPYGIPVIIPEAGIVQAINIFNSVDEPVLEIPVYPWDEVFEFESIAPVTVDSGTLCLVTTYLNILDKKDSFPDYVRRGGFLLKAKDAE